MDLTLVIMAAGIGSRYGGIKQIEPVGQNGELIIDYSIYDAIQAGFTKVVFIIRKDIEEAFKESIFNRISKQIKAEYVFQDINDLPKGFTVPAGRTKPWGTGQAILACKGVVNEPFLVINADDFYGRDAFVSTGKFLKSLPPNSKYHYSSAAYQIGPTISEQGSVSRGVMKVDKNGKLLEINERKTVEKIGNRVFYTENGQQFELAYDAPVSLTVFGLTPDVFTLVEERFPKFLSDSKNDPLKSEFILPGILGEFAKEKIATFDLFESRDKWFGFTYKEDKEKVNNELREMIKAGKYPPKLWN